MAKLTTLYLMRHGEVSNPQGILYGRQPGYVLSQAGREQARAAGRWLADKPLSAIYSSPMERAQQTAAIVASFQPGLQPVIDQRLIEVLTPYEGQPTAELAKTGWDLYTGNQPPYEKPLGVLERVWSFIDDFRRRHAGGSAAAVAHGDILVFPWLHAHGFVPEALMKDDLRSYRLPVDYPATASIMSFRFDDARPDDLPRVAYHCPY